MSEHTFVSYAREDLEMATRLAKTLKADGLEVWFDKLDIPTGSSWDQEVEAGLKASQRLIVVLSPDSVGSKNVMDEVGYAIDEGKGIIPLLYRECDIPMRLRRTQYIDFRDPEDPDAIAQLEAALKGGGMPELAGDVLTPRKKKQLIAIPIVALLLLALGAWAIWGGDDEPAAAAVAGYAWEGNAFLELGLPPGESGPVPWMATHHQLEGKPSMARLTAPSAKDGKLHFEPPSNSGFGQHRITPGPPPVAEQVGDMGWLPFAGSVVALERRGRPISAPEGAEPTYAMALFAAPGRVHAIEGARPEAPSEADNVTITVVNLSKTIVTLTAAEGTRTHLDPAEAVTFAVPRGRVFDVMDVATGTRFARFTALDHGDVAYIATLWQRSS